VSENNSDLGQSRHRPEIIFLSDERKGEAVAFDNDVVSFGRSPDCNIVFRGAPLTVSRVHARIIKKSRFYLFENIGPNGSLVNGKPVQRCELNSGDVIQFSEGGPSVRFIAPPASPDQSEDSLLNLHVGQDVHAFPSGTMLIGSAEDCDYIFQGIESHHALIQYENGDCRVKNLAAQDVLFVEGKMQQTECSLQEDVVLQIGRDGPRFKYLGSGRLLRVKDKHQSQSSDELRTYIIPAPKPSLLDKFKRSKN